MNSGTTTIPSGELARPGLSNLDIGKTLFSLYLFFLPFTNVFVISIGFPLKISEMLLFVLIFLRIIRPVGKVRIPNRMSDIFICLAFFTATALVSTLVNSFWSYDYELNYYADPRIGYGFESYLKLFYVILSVLSFFLIRVNLPVDAKHYLKVFLWGGLAAALFCWYLFFSTFLHYTPQFFNGSDEPHQTMGIPFIGEFYRSGTFREGNHMGLFLLVCVFVAHQMRSKLTAVFALTIITTFSTPAIFGCLSYFLVYFIWSSIRRGAYLRLILLGFLFAAGTTFVFSNELVRSFTLNKIMESDESAESYSKYDRLDLITTSARIGAVNPVLGVGLSNFSLHYKEYATDIEKTSELKRIVNNVYLEIFCELGIVALVLFLAFIILIFSRIPKFKSRLGFFVFLVYLNVYPTFTLLFLWFFLAALACFRERDFYLSNKM